MYPGTINYSPPQLLISGTGTVAVTNPVKDVLVIGFVCVTVCVCVCVCVYVCIYIYIYILGV